MSQSSETLVEQLAWPLERLAEAVEELARHGGLGAPVRPGNPPAPGPARAAQPEALSAWLQTAAAGCGLEAEPVEVLYTEVEHYLRAGGPTLAMLSGPGGPRFLLVLRGQRRRVRVLGPDGVVRRLSVASVRAMLCAELEGPAAAAVEALLARVGVPEAEWSRARGKMVRQRLRGAHIGPCWFLRLPPGASFPRQLAHSGSLGGRLATLGLAHAIQYVLVLLSWWLLGRGALSGIIEPGWLLAWALVLLATVPCQLLGTWAAGMLAIDVGAALKRRLLTGALALAPEEIRHQGAGQLLGQVLQTEAVETFGLRGGLIGLIGFVELLATLWVLGQGAGGAWHALLLLGWIALAVVLVLRSLDDYERRMEVRLSMTHDIVEQMVGYRTRLAQQPPEQWHEGEDQLVDRHLERMKRTDRTGVLLTVLLPRGWLVLGTLGLVPAFARAGVSPAALAVSVGGVLLAYTAFRRLATGTIMLIDVRLTWRRIATLFRAARRAELPRSAHVDLARETEPDTSPATGPRVILEARELVFRYRDRARPVLEGYNLTIAAGDRLLVEGTSGAGKSTLGSLLAGLRQPESGLILLGGLDHATLGSQGWRRRIVAAPQFHENHVLMGTFAFNLLMGRRWPAQPGDLEEAWAICRELELGGLLERMPAGMQQQVGETGWQLSHGERSRLYIARALLHGADLIILDESFAALDPETLRKTLACVLRRARALMVIAHP
jgi:ATP-binding cassette subfamily B protein